MMAAGDYVFTVTDNLPAFSDHHANPDPGLAAVLCAFLSHCRGKWLVDRLLNAALVKYESPSTFFVLLYLVIQRDLLGMQRLLNSTEFNVHQLTVLLDCRGLHKVRSKFDRDILVNRAAL